MITALALLFLRQDAQTYLDKALDIIEKYSIDRGTDWTKMRQVAHEKAVGAKTPQDTYPAIWAALNVVHNKHTFFIPANSAKQLKQGKMRTPAYDTMDRWVCVVVPGGPADRAGLRLGQRVEEVDGKPVHTDMEILRAEDVVLEGDRKDYTVTLSAKGRTFKRTVRPEVTAVNRDPFGRELPGRIGYVFVPAFTGSNDQARHYADVLSGLFVKMDRPGLKGWVVDLRLNQGGNMYPMLAGLSPILDAGPLGYFVGIDNRHPWSVKDGASMEGEKLVTKVTKPYRCKDLKLPIAVLLDSKCASSGEITAISFVGMSNARTFGMPTAGYTTANEAYDLDDGARLIITVMKDADRNGNLTAESITPEVKVQTNWEHFCGRMDEGIAAARQWIGSYRSGR